MTIDPRRFAYRDGDGVSIAALEWAPESPLGIVQISHGIGEHSGRYDDFARVLAASGFAVLADDHRGHCETWRSQWDGDPSKLGRVGPGGLRAAEAAIVQLTGIARERYPGLPVTMFAHSWGSLMAQRIMNREPRIWDAVVLSGSAFRTLRHMESGKLNARWATPESSGFEWLSRDPRVARAFAADPLCFDADTAKLLGFADSLRLLGTPAAGLAPDVPILITSGSEDPLSRGDGLARLGEAYRRRGVRDVSVKVYPGARHEILNETNRDEVVSDIVSWILERTASD